MLLRVRLFEVSSMPTDAQTAHVAVLLSAARLAHGSA